MIRALIVFSATMIVLQLVSLAIKALTGGGTLTGIIGTAIFVSILFLVWSLIAVSAREARQEGSLDLGIPQRRRDKAERD